MVIAASGSAQNISQLSFFCGYQIVKLATFDIATTFHELVHQKRRQLCISNLMDNQSSASITIVIGRIIFLLQKYKSDATDTRKYSLKLGERYLGKDHCTALTFLGGYIGALTAKAG